MIMKIILFVLTFSTRNWAYFDCARLMYRLCGTNVLSLLDLCFGFVDLCLDFLNKNWVCFDFVLDLYFSRPIYDMFRLSRAIFRNSRPIFGMFRLLDRRFSVATCSTFNVKTQVEHVDPGDIDKIHNRHNLNNNCNKNYNNKNNHINQTHNSIYNYFHIIH